MVKSKRRYGNTENLTSYRNELFELKKTVEDIKSKIAAINKFKKTLKTNNIK